MRFPQGWQLGTLPLLFKCCAHRLVFVALAKAATALKTALDEKATLVSKSRRTKKVFCCGPHELEVALPKGSVVAGMPWPRARFSS